MSLVGEPEIGGEHGQAGFALLQPIQCAGDANPVAVAGERHPELAERMGLHNQVVSDLVQEALDVQRARSEGLEVSDEELNAQIHAVPAFPTRSEVWLYLGEALGIAGPCGGPQRA